MITGDSISAGYGIAINQGWVELLQQRLHDNHYQYRVINASISGNTTSDGLSSLSSQLIQYAPQITIIELGGNDGLRGLQISTIKNNLLAMINLAQKAKSKVILLGVRMPPNYGLTYTSQFTQLYSDFAKSADISVVTNFLTGVDSNPQLMQDDGIHPNYKAQIKLLDNVWPDLKKLLNNSKTR